MKIKNSVHDFKERSLENLELQVKRLEDSLALKTSLLKFLRKKYDSLASSIPSSSEEPENKLEDLFKSGKDTKEAITSLLEVINTMRREKQETDFNFKYDPATSTFSAGKLDKVVPFEDVQSLVMVLSNFFPDKKVTLEMGSSRELLTPRTFDSLLKGKVKDDRPKEVDDYAEFRKYIETLDDYLEGTQVEIQDIPLESAPEKAREFLKALYAGDYILSLNEYEEYVPSFKEALQDLGVQMRNLPLLADSVSKEFLYDSLRIIGLETNDIKRVSDCIVGTPSEFKYSKSKKEGMLSLEIRNGLYLNY